MLTHVPELYRAGPAILSNAKLKVDKSQINRSVLISQLRHICGLRNNFRAIYGVL